MEFFNNPVWEEWPQILQRPQNDDVNLSKIVSTILADVKLNGDEALKKYTLQFDHVNLESLMVSDLEIDDAVSLVGKELKAAIQLAKDNIEKFHKSQIEEIKEVETSEGIMCWRKSVAIERVGLYIPGGTAPLFSTLLMLAIPALLAGCREVVVCTPADRNGKVNDVVLYVAYLLGLKNVYKIGGIQAIGAMAYGTETISKVYKIFGPGNQYVTAAKQKINSEGIAIDMPAGPSELAIYADKSSICTFVAADVLSQAEHGPDSQVLLISDSEQTINSVHDQINLQLANLSRRTIIKSALHNCRSVLINNIDIAFDFLNEYAPEHLIIASDNAKELSQKVVNAGSVFLGNYSPESAGDYASGTNHTLPTNGHAKAYSGVALDSFVKKITFQKISIKGIINIGKTVETLAAAEGLDAHKNAITVRLNKRKDSDGI